MIWVTWRQHRLEGAIAMVALAILAGATTLVAHELNAGGCPSQGGNELCFPTDALGSFAQSLMRINLVPYGLAVLPAVAGAFISAPLVARELETGTSRFVWTQGVTRVHWLLVKATLVCVPLLVAAALLGWLEVLLINAQGPDVNRWDHFDQQVPMTVASTAFALALGLAAGAVIRRSIPAMAATLLGFVVTRVGIAELARPHFMTPLSTSTPESVPTSAWWLNSSQQVMTSPGHFLAQSELYQPADRFWAFQGIESGILIAISALILGYAVYWVARRVS
jgi:ABC-type transport system involved in multi-copper enzyme maturation permease subunit